MVDTTLLQRRYADCLHELDEAIRVYQEKRRTLPPDRGDLRLLAAFELRHVLDRALWLQRALQKMGIQAPPPPPTPVDHGDY